MQLLKAKLEMAELKAVALAEAEAAAKAAELAERIKQ